MMNNNVPRKTNLAEAVFEVLRHVNKGQALSWAINDVANSMARDYEEYMTIWTFLDSLVW